MHLNVQIIGKIIEKTKHLRKNNFLLTEYYCNKII